MLATTNEVVHNLSCEVIKAFPKDEMTYYSFDSVLEDVQNLYLQENVNTFSLGCLPSHKLTLKVGSPIMLLRNHDPKARLCNRTRLICRNLYKNFIDAKIANRKFSSTRVFIPRVSVNLKENDKLQFSFIRKQF